MSISRLLIAIAYILVLLMWIVAWIAGGPANGADVVGLALATALSAFLALLAMTYRRRADALVLLFVGRAMLSYLLPFLYAKFFPDPSIIYHGNAFGPLELNRAFGFALLGLVATGIGLRVGVGIYRRNNDNDAPPPLADITVDRAAILCIAICVINLLGYYFLGVGRYTTEERGYFNKLMTNLIYPMDTVLVVLMAVYAGWAHTARAAAGRTWARSRWGMPLALVVFYLVVTLTGSKGALYFIVLYWVMARMASDGDFSIPLRRVFRYSIPIVVLGAVGLYAGYYIKWVTRMASVNTGEVSIDVSEVISSIDTKESLTGMEALAIPVRRLSELEQVVETVNRPRGTCSRYINWSLTFESAFDRVMPGTYFNVLPSERVYALCYRGFTLLEQLETVQQNDKWGILALYYVYGGWIGGPLLLLVSGLLIGLGYAWIDSRRTADRMFYLVWYLVLFDFWFSGFGLDAVASNLIPYLLQGIIYISVLRWIRRLQLGLAQPAISGQSASLA